jgi:hypothetical protein
MKTTDDKIIDLEVKNLIREEQEKIVDHTVLLIAAAVIFAILLFGNK